MKRVRVFDRFGNQEGPPILMTDDQLTFELMPTLPEGYRVVSTWVS